MALNWQVSASPSGPQVQLSAAGGPWLSLGSPKEVLEECHTPAELAWRCRKSDSDLLSLFMTSALAVANCYNSFPPEHDLWLDPEHYESLLGTHSDAFSELIEAPAKRRAFEFEANTRVCNLWLSATGLRVKDDSKWRALSLNAVLHSQFGPGYTAATNGVDVLLVSAPSLTAEWMLVHRSNVIGPVTGTEVGVDEWDWLSNKALPPRALPNGEPKKLTRQQKLDLL